MGLLCPNLVAFHFDCEGTLLRVEEREVSFFYGVMPPYKICDERIPPLIDAWKAEHGFRPSTIRVKQFFSVKHGAGIEEYPTHFTEILEDPASDDVEKADIRASMESWDEDGNFVLYWGNDYWLNESGEVVSS